MYDASNDEEAKMDAKKFIYDITSFSVAVAIQKQRRSFVDNLMFALS